MEYLEKRALHCIAILYHGGENAVGNTICRAYAQRTMGRLGVILNI